MKVSIEQAIAKAQEMVSADQYGKVFHLGMDRRVVAKDWKGQRTYINVMCYTLAGNYKGRYDCGYVDTATGEYVSNQYTDVALF